MNELDNNDNLKDERLSNTLFMYYVSSYTEFTCFEPHTPQYKKHKNDKIVSLALRITDQRGNITTNLLGTSFTVVLHIRDYKS